MTWVTIISYFACGVLGAVVGYTLCAMLSVSSRADALAGDQARYVKGPDHVRVETHDGKVCAVWYDDTLLRYRQTLVGRDRAHDATSAYIRHHVPALDGVLLVDARIAHDTMKYPITVEDSLRDLPLLTDDARGTTDAPTVSVPDVMRDADSGADRRAGIGQKPNAAPKKGTGGTTQKRGQKL